MAKVTITIEDTETGTKFNYSTNSAESRINLTAAEQFGLAFFSGMKAEIARQLEPVSFSEDE